MDPIADMLTRIRNAQAVKHQIIDVPFSNLKLKIIQILIKEGFILDCKKIRRNKEKALRIYLKYDQENSPVISEIKRISKPGKRIYVKAGDVKEIRGGFGRTIISTSKGIMTNKEARKKRQGGEVIAEIW